MQIIGLLTFYRHSFNFVMNTSQLPKKPIPSSVILEFGFFRRLATLACDNPQRSWLARRGSLFIDDDTSLCFSMIICHEWGRSPCSRSLPKKIATCLLTVAWRGIDNLHSNRSLMPLSVTSDLNRFVEQANLVMRRICSSLKWARYTGSGSSRLLPWTSYPFGENPSHQNHLSWRRLPQGRGALPRAPSGRKHA